MASPDPAFQARRRCRHPRRLGVGTDQLADLKEELAAIRPSLDGRQVMDHLGVGPGRVVGKALAFLLELRLEEGPMDEREAYERLDAWAVEQKAL